MIGVKVKGVCWARNLTQSMFDGEEYTLQIDSHMRFVPGWDEEMLEELAACASDKPLLSCSPASYTPPNNLQLNPRPTIRRVLPFFPDGNLRGRGEYIDRSPKEPLRGAFVAAGFVFSKSEIIAEVPYDPYLYFDQEEASYAARLFTHGWDVFSSRKPLLYHYYNAENNTVRPLHWQDLGMEDRDRIEYFKKRGIERFNHLVGYSVSSNRDVTKDLTHYGFGAMRSLKEYEDFSGIDFKRKVASERALRCQFIDDLTRYRDAPIHIPEIDGKHPPKAASKKQGRVNDNNKTAALKEEPVELTTLDPTVRLKKTYPEILPKLGVGDFAPLFVLLDDGGNRRALEVLAGRHSMLVFFSAKDKNYTTRFFGALNSLLEKQGKLNMWQVFVAGEPVDALAKVKKSLGIQALLWADSDLHVAKAFNVLDEAGDAIVPTGFLLDRNLKIIGRHERLDPEQLAGAIVNQCANAIQQDELQQGEPQIITHAAPVLLVPDVLSPEFCDHCIKEFTDGHTFQGTVGSEKDAAMRKDVKMRTDFVVHGKLLDQMDEKFSRSLFPEIKKVFGFDVTYREIYKIGLYSGEDKGFFKQHRDNFDTPLGNRRVAVTIHLSDDYEGGGVRFPEYGNNIYRASKGGAVAFSASSIHEAMPVTKGKRYVIVAFLHGDQDEAYRRHYQVSAEKPLKVQANAPLFA